jgi:hypothetical protein
MDGSAVYDSGGEMRKLILYILIFILICLFGCKGPKKSLIKQKNVGGVLHVYNPAEPLEGRVKLEVREILRIDSLSINKDNPPRLQLFARDKNNRVYLCDRRTPRMYRFSPDGQLLGQFIQRGEGPGEFPGGIYAFQVINNRLWLSHSRKLACFTPEGGFDREWKFNRSITFVEMAGEEKFIGNLYENDLSDQRKRVCAVFNRSGDILQRLFEDPEAGFSEIQMSTNGRTRILRFFSGLITNDILHTFDPEENRVYLYLSRDYRIHCLDLLGRAERIIHRDYLNPGITERDKTAIISEVFSRWPAERRELLKDVFPETFVAINMIGILPRGHIAVRRVIGFQNYEFDVFDRQGRFVYVLEPPTELPGFYRIDLRGNLIWIFNEQEERDIFSLYEMTNLPV